VERVVTMHIVRAGGIEGFSELVRSMGQSPGRLLEQVGLEASALRDPDAYVPYEKVAELFRVAAECCDDELFGIKLSAPQGRRTLGLLGLFISSQPTIGAAMAFAGRYTHFHASGVRLSQTDMGSFSVIELSFDLPERIGLEQLRQHAVGLLSRLLARMAPPGWRPLKILLRQREPSAGRGEMERFFGCPVSFESELDGLMLQNAILRQPPAVSTEQMRKLLDEHVRTMESQYPGSIVDQAAHIIGTLLPLSECSLEAVARLLDLHPRVLQQRLTAQGTTYQRILDETRLDIARQHLQYTRTPLTDLALNLGFAELAVFSRAFRRWTGISPSNWRKAHSSPA
jgi:AraC-like DNA-binding protein